VSFIHILLLIWRHIILAVNKNVLGKGILSSLAWTSTYLFFVLSMSVIIM
jgi:hypothetical protein